MHNMGEITSQTKRLIMPDCPKCAQGVLTPVILSFPSPCHPCIGSSSARYHSSLPLCSYHNQNTRQVSPCPLHQAGPYRAHSSPHLVSASKKTHYRRNGAPFLTLHRTRSIRSFLRLDAAHPLSSLSFPTASVAPLHYSFPHSQPLYHRVSPHSHDHYCKHPPCLAGKAAPVWWQVLIDHSLWCMVTLHAMGCTDKKLVYFATEVFLSFAFLLEYSVHGRFNIENIEYVPCNHTYTL